MTRFDWIDFAFVTPDQKFNLAFDDPSSSPDILKRVVSAAHAKGTKVKVSIGGWGGSKCVNSLSYFSYQLKENQVLLSRMCKFRLSADFRQEHSCAV